MALLTATISGQITQPDLGPGAVTVWIEATSDGSRLNYPGQVIQGRNKVSIDANGNATINLPQLPQTSMTPSEAVWRLVWHPSTGPQETFEFELTGDTTWDALVDVSGVPITSSLLADAEAARDAAQGYAASAAGSVSLVAWAPSTAYTAGDIRQAPDGGSIQRKANGTSGAAYDSTEQGNWTPLLVKVGYTNHSIMEYASGATINDGTTSASTAITNALAAIPSGGKQRLWLPPGTYLDDASRTLAKGIQIIGDGATIKKGTTTVSGNWWTLNADGLKLSNLIFDDSGSHVTGNLITTGTGKTGLTVEDCTITAPAAVAMRFAGITDLRVYGNTVTSCKTGIWMTSTSVRPDIRRNHIQGWADRGIYMIGDASGASTGLQVVGNIVSNMVYNGTSRYPITVQQGASATAHLSVLIEGNTVLGGNKSYNDPTNAGNADCYGLFGITGLRVLGNFAYQGGDMGITLDGTNAITAATVIGNTCLQNDTGGIAIASGAKDITIAGNVCKNNGQNRNSDRAANTRAGIYLSTGVNVAISGNTLGDDQGTKTQQYGVNMTSSTNVSLGPDIDAGNAVALYTKNGAGNVSIVKVTTAAF